MIIQYTVQKPKQSQGIIHIKLEVYNRKSSTNVVLVTEISITNICIWNLYCDDKPQKWQIKKIYMERKEKEKEKNRFEWQTGCHLEKIIESYPPILGHPLLSYLWVLERTSLCTPYSGSPSATTYLQFFLKHPQAY
jgi:hypothetical protein